MGVFQHVVIDDRLAATNQEQLDINLYVMKLTGTEIRVLTACMRIVFTYEKYVFPRKSIVSEGKNQNFALSPVCVDSGTFSTNFL